MRSFTRSVTSEMMPSATANSGAVLAISVLEARDEALAAGADAFLQKPFDPLELVSTVKDLLGASALVARPAQEGA